MRNMHKALHLWIEDQKHREQAETSSCAAQPHEEVFHLATHNLHCWTNFYQTIDPLTCTALFGAKKEHAAFEWQHAPKSCTVTLDCFQRLRSGMFSELIICPQILELQR